MSFSKPQNIEQEMSNIEVNTKQFKEEELFCRQFTPQNEEGQDVSVASVRPESLFFPDGYIYPFSIRKQTILKKIQEIKEVCAGVLEYGEHMLLRIDTEIF